MSRAAQPVLELAPGLSLPLDATASSFGILGSSGSGKSNTAVVLFEQLVKCGIPAVAVDPKGDWWGIRTSADGKGPGLSVPIFGGLRGDGPLEPGMGRVLAELLVAERLSALLDVSRLSIGGRSRFLVDFLHALFDLHQADPHPRHLVCEEAHRLVPQQVTRDTAALKEAAAKVALEGRAFGVGFTMPSQRSARLNNDVLEQVRTLVIHRTGGPADRKAIYGWVRDHEQAAEMIASLPNLKPGEAWVWSPEYLGIVDRFQMYRRSTFDSGATPKVGEVQRVARLMADVDMAAIKERLGEFVERADANDPAKLHKRTADAEARLARMKADEAALVQRAEDAEAKEAGMRAALVDAEQRLAVAEAREPIVVDVPVLDEALVARVEAALGPAVELLAEVQETVADHRRALTRGDLRPPPSLVTNTPVAPRPRPLPVAVQPTERHPYAPPPAGKASGGEPTLGAGPRGLLAVLASRYPSHLTRRQVVTLARRGPKSSALDGHFAALLTAGLATRDGNGDFAATEAGLVMAGMDDTPGVDDPIAMWRSAFSGATGKVFEALVEAYPRPCSRDEVADRAGLSRTSSSVGAALADLRRNGLVDESADGVAAAAILFR